MRAEAGARRQHWLNTARLVPAMSVGLWREPSVKSHMNLSLNPGSAVWLWGDVLALGAPVSILLM